MPIRSFFLLLLWFPGFMAGEAWAQQIIYQRKMSWLPGEIGKVLRNPAGEIFMVGLARKFGTNIMGNVYMAPFIAKVTDAGDTIFLRGYPGNYAEGFYTAAFTLPDVITIMYKISHAPLPPYAFNLVVLTVSAIDGSVMSRVELQRFYPYPMNSFSDADGYMYFSGPDVDNPKYNIIKISPFGEIKFERYHTPSGVTGAGVASVLTPLPGKKIWMSGKYGGNKIGSLTLDSSGELLDFKPEYVYPYSNYIYGNALLSTNGNRFIISERLENYPGGYHYLLRKVDSSGQILWNGMWPGDLRAAFPTTDGGIFHTYSYPTGQKARKLNADSTTAWEFEISTPGSSPTTYIAKAIKDAAYYSDSSALIVGFSDSTGGPYPYYARIAHVGQPYDPITASKPKVKRDPLASHYAWPNPTTGKMYIQGMGAGRLRFFNSLGQPVLEQDYTVGTEVNLSPLPAGVYTYTLVTPQSKTEGRVVKER